MLPGDIDGKRAIAALRRLGWQVIHRRGSHIKLEGPKGSRLILAIHGKIGRNALTRSLRQAGIDAADFERALR